jgi:hypothetical protein
MESYVKFSILVLFTLISCGHKPQPVQFQVNGTDRVLLGIGREAVDGQAVLTKSKKLEYQFDSPPLVSPPASLEIEYSFISGVTPNGTRASAALEMGGNSWVLPVDDSETIFHYAIPIQPALLRNFNITLAGQNNGSPSIRIHSIELKERWFGFFNLRGSGGVSGSERYFTSPFVARYPDGPGGYSIFEIAPPERFSVPMDFYSVISAEIHPGKEAVFDAGEIHLDLLPALERLNIPAGFISPGDLPLALKGGRVDSFRHSYAKLPPFPKPITADPGLILSWPIGNWRDSRYEVFNWDKFPSLLIFDFVDYDTQDRMLKRLSFFVEKKGFRNRLAPDSEIAELHGWNAHDYRAEDLARFFQTAREDRFPLLAEERELMQILLDAGIIRASGSGGTITAGEGGIISISRESPDYLRSRFMAHEGFHGLFFIDKDFRDFSKGRWQHLPSQAKRFIISYFNYQQYDTADEYLLVNEFMAHVLQQPVSQAGYYFGVSLPLRIETSWRKTELPPKDKTTNSWPILGDAFTREAEAFSTYVEGRWGLAAGRVSLINVRQP